MAGGARLSHARPTLPARCTRGCGAGHIGRQVTGRPIAGMAMCVCFMAWRGFRQGVKIYSGGIVVVAVVVVVVLYCEMKGREGVLFCLFA